VAAHLADCSTCRLAAEKARGDSFVARVQAAGVSRSTDATALPGSLRPAPATPGDLPPELANHPRYRILRELGRGGMGIVYQARQTVMNRPVVIKVINKALLDNSDAVERFRREVQAAARLAHPNIVTAYDAEQAGDLHMLVMEFVPGQSLAEALHKKGPLPVLNACVYVRQAALGLQHAHEQGMVHRDIKPQNLMLTPKGQVKILDFGLAKLVSEHGSGTGLTALNSYMGTPEYSAPEQATDARTADIRADIYSLGCTLYCLLAGRPPFREETAVKTILAHLEKEPTPLPRLRPDVPAALWQVLARMLAKAPSRRYQKPAEVAQALAPFCKPGMKVAPAFPVAAHARTAPAAPPMEPATEPEPWRPVRGAAAPPADGRWWLGALAVALACVLGLAVCLVGGLIFWAVQLSGRPGAQPAAASGKAGPLAGLLPVGPTAAEKSAPSSKGPYPAPVQTGPEKPAPTAPSAKEPPAPPAETGREKQPDPPKPAASVAGADPNPPEQKKRMLRWQLNFTTAHGADYLRQLRSIKPGSGGILAYPVDGERFRVIRDLAERPAEGKIEDLHQIKRIFWIDDKPGTVADLAGALGIKTPPYFVAFFPPELEDELARLEREKAGGAKEDDIDKTVFEVVRDGNDYRPRCVRVQLRPGVSKGPAKTGEPAKPQPAGKSVQGSGHGVTEERKLADFTRVEVDTAIQVTIRRGENFGVAVTADDNLVPFIKTAKYGAAVLVRMESVSFQTRNPLTVEVTMPALEGVRLTRGGRAKVEGFRSGKEFRAELTEGSILEGEIRPEKLDIDVSGAGQVKLSGLAKDAKLKASGPGGRLWLADFAADNVDVDLSGVCQAEVQAKTRLDYSVREVCQLRYRGSPTIGKHEVVFPSTVSPLSP
jgi:tRNA A-37 threonylcarbamoyl transferase component Bud32